jgi:hypothetical protein
VSIANIANVAKTTIEIIEIFRWALAKSTLRDMSRQKYNRAFVKFCIRRHTGVAGHFITMVGTFSDEQAHATEANAARPVHVIHKERGSGAMQLVP